MVLTWKIVLWITFNEELKATKKFISEMITGDEFLAGRFNIIASGTGTGKTEFVRRTLLTKFDSLLPSEILYVTSRSMTRDQQAELDGIERLGQDDIDIIQYWNGEIEELKRIQEAGIYIMNYNQFIHILDYCDPEEGEPLTKIRIAVFDECHALFSDDFITGMGVARQWIRERIRDESVILIGMTATKGILDYNSRRFGKQLKTVNDDYIVNYKAKHLIVSSGENLLSLLANRNLPGKTIILCPTIRECKKINEYYYNSVMLFSPNNKDYAEYMPVLRKFIIENETLPEDTSILCPGYERGIHPIDVLLTTTSMREGINLREESGIKNVICCIPDEMHVKQFMGRCRYSVDNLIVVHTFHKMDNFKKGDYIADSRKMFADYLSDKNNHEWFDTISEIVDCSFDDVERYLLDPQVDEFCSWVDSMWTCRKDMPEDEFRKRRICKDDYEEFEYQAWKYRLFGRFHEKYTFNSILRYMCYSLGYRCESSRGLDDENRKVTYKYLFK